MENSVKRPKEIKLFEEVFVKKLRNSTNNYLLNQENNLKDLIKGSFDMVYKELETKNNNINCAKESITIESNKEKKYFGNELHNGLQQVLASLNFYIEALKNQKTEIRESYLNKITKLGHEAFDLSKNISDSLMFSPIKGEEFLINIQEFCKSFSNKNKTIIKIDFVSSFKEPLLSKIQKHQVLNISKDILFHLTNTFKPNVLMLKYSFKYNNSILQINIFLPDVYISQLNLEQQNVLGYNNLKHKLDTFKARLYQKENNKLIIKIPISNK